MEIIMKKAICVILSAVLICLSFAGCSSGGSAKEDAVLKVGYTGDCAPFITVSKSGDGTGFDVELLKLIANDYGLPLDFTKIEFVKMQAGDELSSAENSELPRILIGGIKKNVSNLNKSYMWSDVIISSDIIVIANESSGIKKYNDLVGKKVLYAGENAKAALDKNSSLSSTMILTKSDSAQKAVELLKAGKADAAVVETLDYGTLGADTVKGIAALNGKLDTVEYAFAFAKSDEDLCNSFNEGFAKACNDPDKGDVVSPLAKKAFKCDGAVNIPETTTEKD